MEDLKRKLLEILGEMHPDVDFESCSALVDQKVLDSFDIVTLISEINDEFDVVISADKIIPENFNSVDALCRMIFRIMEENE